MRILGKDLYQRDEGFTLIEIMIVFVILGIIAAFAVPAYDDLVTRKQQENMMVVARAFHGALDIYKARHGDYWRTVAITDLDDINNELGTSFEGFDGFSFQYQSPDLAKGHEWDLEMEEIGLNWEIRVTNAPLSDTNPCCDPDGDPASMCKVTLCP